MKLLSFDGGVTVQGGLRMPVATPAHGTAFDIVGKNLADVTSTQNAFDLAVTMAKRKILNDAGSKKLDLGYASAKAGVPVAKRITVVLLVYMLNFSLIVHLGEVVKRSWLANLISV